MWCLLSFFTIKEDAQLQKPIPISIKVLPVVLVTGTANLKKLVIKKNQSHQLEIGIQG
jgi:hypothetical protein